MLLFKVLVGAHIVTGSVGLVSLWIPVAGRKGNARHQQWGRVFAHSMLATGLIAIGISLTTLRWPMQTHPFASTHEIYNNVPLIRGIFGWMMLYLATLTIMLSRYGLLSVRHKRDHTRLREPVTVGLQMATLAVAVNCAWQGWLLAQPLMMGISVVGVAAALLNLRYIFGGAPPMNEWLIQHSRGLVGAGISVYTAFLAFGAVNLLPAIALHPVLWSIPTIVGVSVLIWHQGRIMLLRRKLELQRPATSPSAPA